jgi:hypothetical protein
MQIYSIEAYFHFLAVQRSGVVLLDLGGAKPVEHVSQMSKDNAAAYAEVCWKLIVEQQKRLHRLNELLHGHAALDIFGANFRSRIDKIIGDKEKGLLGAAAAVEFYLIGFVSLNDEEVSTYGREMAAFRYQGHIISMIVGTDHESEVIDLELARANLDALSSATEELRKVIMQQCDHDLLLELTKAAEAKAIFPGK